MRNQPVGLQVEIELSREDGLCSCKNFSTDFHEKILEFGKLGRSDIVPLWDAAPQPLFRQFDRHLDLPS